MSKICVEFELQDSAGNVSTLQVDMSTPMGQFSIGIPRDAKRITVVIKDDHAMVPRGSGGGTYTISKARE